MSKKIAFVLGNGTSRKYINLEILKQHGTIYGCNALYREFAPDHLVAVDTKMVIEICDKGYQNNYNVWSNSNKLTEKTPNIKIIKPNKGWSSGPTAMLLASQHDHTEIYLLGFDYVGLGESQQFVNNMYAGTKNYKRIEDRATYYGNWTRQTMMCANTYPRTKYVRVIPDSRSFIPDHLKDLQNFSHIHLEIFKRNFGLTAIR
jgi:hypothetical protein